MKTLKQICKEMADELEAIYDHEYQLRHNYPILERKYQQDMALVNEARKLLD